MIDNEGTLTEYVKKKKEDELVTFNRFTSIFLAGLEFSIKL